MNNNWNTIRGTKICNSNNKNINIEQIKANNNQIYNDFTSNHINLNIHNIDENINTIIQYEFKQLPYTYTIKDNDICSWSLR